MRDVRLDATSPVAFSAGRCGASFVSGAPCVYSWIQAVRGAKGHTSVLAAEISPRASTGYRSLAEKATPAGIIAVEAVETAQATK